MKKIRINELARELEVKPGVIIELLPELGVEEKKTHSSSIDEDVAIILRQRLTGSGGPLKDVPETSNGHLQDHHAEDANAGSREQPSAKTSALAEPPADTSASEPRTAGEGTTSGRPLVRPVRSTEEERSKPSVSAGSTQPHAPEMPLAPSTTAPNAAVPGTPAESTQVAPEAKRPASKFSPLRPPMGGGAVHPPLASPTAHPATPGQTNRPISIPARPAPLPIPGSSAGGVIPSGPRQPLPGETRPRTSDIRGTSMAAWLCITGPCTAESCTCGIHAGGRSVGRFPSTGNAAASAATEIASAADTSRGTRSALGACCSVGPRCAHSASCCTHAFIVWFGSRSAYCAATAGNPARISWPAISAPSGSPSTRFGRTFAASSSYSISAGAAISCSWSADISRARSSRPARDAWTGHSKCPHSPWPTSAWSAAHAPDESFAARAGNTLADRAAAAPSGEAGSAAGCSQT